MVAVVTGSSRGIGKGIAEELLKKGFDVILTARNKTEQVDELSEKYQGKVNFVSPLSFIAYFMLFSRKDLSSLGNRNGSAYA